MIGKGGAGLVWTLPLGPGHIMGAGRRVQQGGDWGVPSLSSSQLLLLVQGHLGKFGVSSAVNQGWEDFCLLRR